MNNTQPIGSIMSRSQSVPTAAISLQLFTKTISISNELTDSYKVYIEIIDRMLSHGHANLLSLRKTPIVLKLSESSKSIYRIVSSSRMISTNGRHGNADFILMNREMISAFGEFITTDSDNNMILPNGVMVIPHPVKDKTVIGRATKSQSPGVAMATFGNRYEIFDLGFYPERQYLTLDIDYA